MNSTLKSTISEDCVIKTIIGCNKATEVCKFFYAKRRLYIPTNVENRKLSLGDEIQRARPEDIKIVKLRIFPQLSAASADRSHLI